jgi:hypothetical protein
MKDNSALPASTITQVHDILARRFFIDDSPNVQVITWLTS